MEPMEEARDVAWRTVLSLLNQEASAGVTEARGYDKIVKMLLDQGASTTITSLSGHTARPYAVANGHRAVVRLLRNRA